MGVELICQYWQPALDKSGVNVMDASNCGVVCCKTNPGFQRRVKSLSWQSTDIPQNSFLANQC